MQDDHYYKTEDDEIVICGTISNSGYVYSSDYVIVTSSLTTRCVILRSHTVLMVCFVFRGCPDGTTCIQAGPNPNWGFTHFDNFPWAMLNTFQLVTLDFWENTYNMVSSWTDY